MNRLILGDVLDALRTIDDESVDLLVTDPPYLNITGGNSLGKDAKEDRRPKGILKVNDGKIFQHNAILPEQYLPELFRVLKPQAHVYLMTNFLGLKEGLIQTLHRHGFDTHNLLIWRKNNATPNRWYMKDLEYTIFARKGPAFPVKDNGMRSSLTVFEHPLDFDNPKSPKLHPTEKPVNLMDTYIRQSTDEGAVVLDPFMGAGSTGVAAALAGRQFIGIEIDPAFFAIAEQRIPDSDSAQYAAPINHYLRLLGCDNFATLN